MLRKSCHGTYSTAPGNPATRDVDQHLSADALEGHCAKKQAPVEATQLALKTLATHPQPPAYVRSPTLTNPARSVVTNERERSGGQS